MTVIGVAIEESLDAVMPFAEGVTFPVLLDREHVLTELYAISNVPAVVWIDEDDRIVVPNTVAFGTDTFSEFTGVSSEPHKDEVRRWVRDGVLPLGTDAASAAVEDLSSDEVRARLEFRLGAHLRRSGDAAAAAAHFERAGELAPMDFTIRRAAMPLQGQDPFGEDFMGLYAEWNEAGKPFHGIG